MKLYLKKCKKCLYYLGIIKCVVSPCPECIASKRKNPPFAEPVIKYQVKKK